MRKSACRIQFYFAFLLGSFLILGCGKKEKENEEAKGEVLAPVHVKTADEMPLAEWTALIGTPQPLPNHAARITAPLEGRVLWVRGDKKDDLIAEGQTVKKGDVIVQLDDRVAKANLAKANAALGDLGEQQAQAEGLVKGAKIDVDRLEKLQKDSKNARDFPLTSQIELEKARIACKDAESKLKGAQAKLAGGKAELQAIETQIELYKLRAPIAGRLGLLQVVVGQTLSAGAVVAEVIDLKEVDILCFASPHTALELAVGQTARLIEEEEETAKKSAPGKIVFVAAQGAAETGNFAVKARFDNSKGRLRGNTIVHLEVETKSEEKRLTIPVSALMEDSDPPMVVIVEDIETKKKEDKEIKLGKARRMEAIIGVHTDAVVEIKELKDSEKKKIVQVKDALFVVEGGRGLHDGDAVKLEDEEKKEEK